MTESEPRDLLATLLGNAWNITPKPDIYSDDVRRDPIGMTPMLKVYPENSPSQLKGRGESQNVNHHLTVKVTARDRATAFAAKNEVNRILDLYQIQPFAGYDLMNHQDGDYRGGNQWLSQWDIRITLYQFRKAVVRR